MFGLFRRSAMRSQRHAVKHSRGKGRARLLVELLEDRQVPAQFFVTNTDDLFVANAGDAPGTLRQAIFDANASGGPDEIVFQGAGTSGTIVLDFGEIDITEDLTVSGPGAANLTVSGNNQSRIFRIGDGSAARLNVNINGLTLIEGNTSSVNGGFDSPGGAIYIENENVAINNSVITGNNAFGDGGGVYLGYHYEYASGGSGGGTYVGGILTVRNSTISGNVAAGVESGHGGGIFAADYASVTIEDSTISNNIAAYDGGGVYLACDGVLVVRDSTISGNIAGDGDGGGLFSCHGTSTTVEDSTLSGNVAGAGNGGGIALLTDTALTVRRSTISGNTASDAGGGIGWFAPSSSGANVIEDSSISGNFAGAGGGVFLYRAFDYDTPVTIRNSTISGNQANGGRFESGIGGGVLLVDGDAADQLYQGSIALTLQNTTIAGNTASSAGGGISVFIGGLTLQSTIVADNSAFSGGGNDISNESGGAFNAEFSLIEDPNGGTINDLGNNLIGLDPLLGALANNGGPTQTHALLPGSPAFNTGSNPANLSFDQRGTGFPRVIGAQVDIGAFEGGLSATLVDSLAADANGNGVANPGDIIQYAATFINTGGVDIESLIFNATIDVNTTEVAGSVRVTPIALDDQYSAAANSQLVIDAANGILQNDFDPDGPFASLSVTSVSRVGGGVTGTLTVNPDGSFTYDAPSDNGFERFQYFITDAQGLNNVIAGFLEFTIDKGPGQILPSVPTLTQAELDGVVAAARQRWASTGLSASQFAALYQTQFFVADLSSADLASLALGHAFIDVNAAGLGWYVDLTPFSDSEFADVLSATRRAAAGASPLAAQFDLLTVVMNQMGRLMGFDSGVSPDLLSTPVAGVRNLAAGENLAPALDSLFAAHGFRFKDSYYQDWLGHGEKWFIDRNNVWHFVTGNGSVYRWSGAANNTLADDALVSSVHAIVYADPTRLFHAPAQLAPGVVQQLAQWHQTYGFHFAGSYWEDWLNQGEKWFLDRAGSWFYIKPDGSVFHGNGTLLTILDSDVHADPTALFRAAPAMSGFGAQPLAELQSRHGFHFAGSYYENWLNRGEKWFQDRADQWYFITGNGEIWRWGGGTAADTLIRQVDSQVHNNPNLLLQKPTALSVFQTAAPLTQRQLAAIVVAAQQRWIATGLSSAQLTALQTITFEVANFTGAQLGTFNANHLRLDVDGGGHGWFIDATPMDDVEFAHVQSATFLSAHPLSAPAGRVDLLTTVMHEIGHALGLADTYALAHRDSVMYGYLGVGERHLPALGEATGALPGSISAEVFLVSPTINVLPAAKGVRIFYQATVNSPLPAGVTKVCSQGTFAGQLNAGGSLTDISVVTDDPDTTDVNDPTCTPVAANVSGGRSLWLPFG